MPRRSSKSAASPSPAKRPTRKSVETASSTLKSPAIKAAPAASSAAKSRRSTPSQHTTPSSAAKKAASPSPKPKKNAASPKKSTERGRSTSRQAKGKAEEMTVAKGKSTSRSPAKPRASASKSKAASSQPTASKLTKSPKKSTKSPKPKSPTKTVKSPASTPKSGKRSKSTAGGADSGTGKSSGKKSVSKPRSPAKSTTPKTPRASAKKTTTKAAANIEQLTDDTKAEQAAVDESEIHETEGEKSEDSEDKPGVETPEKMELEVIANDIKPTASAGRKRKREETAVEDANDQLQQPESKIQKTANENGVAIVENISDVSVASGSSQLLATCKDISYTSCDVAPVDELAADDGDNDANADYENDYEIISKDDVPSADNDEVIRAAEKMVPSSDPEVISDSEGNSPVLDGVNDRNHNGSESGVLFSRTFITNPAVGLAAGSAGRVFSVVSYNILADVHAQKDFAGDKASWITDDQLAISYRHQQLLKELQYLDADVICLQEVDGDYLAGLLSPAMEKLGYKGIFIPRNTTRYCEGEATFYRTSAFSLESSRTLKLSDVTNEEIEASSLDAELKGSVKVALETYGVAVIVKLKSVTTDDEIAVANVHITYDNLVRPDRRCIQLAMVIRNLVEMANGGTKPCVICGDFNSWPESAPYQFVSSGQLTDETLEELQAVDDAVVLSDGQTAPVVNVWPEGFYFPAECQLKSSYAVVAGSEPLTSRYAFDGGLRAVDYIWYSSTSLQPVGVLEVVKPDLIKPGVPSAVFPSDHMSLKAKFAFS